LDCEERKTQDEEGETEEQDGHWLELMKLLAGMAVARLVCMSVGGVWVGMGT